MGEWSSSYKTGAPESPRECTYAAPPPPQSILAHKEHFQCPRNTFPSASTRPIPVAILKGQTQDPPL